MDEGAGTANRWFVLIAVGISTFMAALDGSVVNVALPAIAARFTVGMDGVQWVVTTYVLAISALLLVFGKLGDAIGYGKLLLAGFAVFGAASALCGASPFFGWLIAARVLQGIGAAMTMSAGPALISTTFPAAERGRALGMQATATYLGLALGPSVGGFLTHRWSWHWIFLVNVPISIAGVAIGLRVLGREPVKRVRIDAAGAALFAAGLTALIFGMGEAPAWGFHSPAVIVPLVAAPLLLAAFVRRQATTEEPLLPLSMFRVGSFSGGVAASWLQYVVVFTTGFLVPFFLQGPRGLDPARTGELMTAQPAVMVLTTGLAGWLSDRIGPRIPATGGMAILALGVWLLSRLPADAGYPAILGALAVVGLGVGLFTSPNNSAILGSAPRERQGVASALLAASRNLGMAMGVPAGALLMSRRRAAAGGAFLPAYRETLLALAALAVAGALLSLFRPRASGASRP